MEKPKWHVPLLVFHKPVFIPLLDCIGATSRPKCILFVIGKSLYCPTEFLQFIEPLFGSLTKMIFIKNK